MDREHDGRMGRADEGEEGRDGWTDDATDGRTVWTDGGQDGRTDARTRQTDRRRRCYFNLEKLVALRAPPAKYK